jgi:prepilin-type processing-associated H-X9-DG protein
MSNGENGVAASLVMGIGWGWTPPAAVDYLRYRGGKAPFGFMDGHVEVFDAKWFVAETGKGLSSEFFDEANTF